ncbi:unnamed protein product [Symbiodinium natans]|uniref:NAD(P)(+)--arginine ADP-ribosyltransferase n=1 Tax=Symbiodinium natans TaxID=878477 RepID=A0A812UW25_9DINO|nr:unnamed protein product [Symbiodinium natans]
MKPGKKLIWFEPKSSSRNFEVMHQGHFCGLDGPRAAFAVHSPLPGFRIDRFSAYGTGEEEVLFPPLTVLEVVDSQKWNQEKKQGFPDDVVLKQVESKILNLELFPGFAQVAAPVAATTAMSSVVPAAAEPTQNGPSPAHAQLARAWRQTGRRRLFSRSTSGPVTDVATPQSASWRIILHRPPSCSRSRTS